MVSRFFSVVRQSLVYAREPIDAHGFHRVPKLSSRSIDFGRPSS
jgi:hypothetical protein